MMTNFEHAVVIDAPIADVASQLDRPSEGPPNGPTILKFSLVGSHDGREADLELERIRTQPLARICADDPDQLYDLLIPFAGRGVSGEVTYRLRPVPEGTELVQRVVYTFTGSSSINVLEPVTTQLTEQVQKSALAAVKESIEARAGSPPQEHRSVPDTRSPRPCVTSVPPEADR